MLKGSSNPETPYLINEQNEKVYDTHDKLELHKNYWQSIFRINPEENRNYDLNHERIILQAINDNRIRIQSYETSDLSRLEINNVLTRPVTIHDIKRIIKNFKNKAPRKSGINKMILINLPESAYAQYAQIINHTLALGYFPIIFKE